MEIKKILVATDFSALSRKALETALSLTTDAEFQILHANQYLSPEDEMRWMGPYTDAEAYMRQLKRLEAGDLNARRRRPGLVAVGATGTMELRHILLGSTATHALRELRCDVLVVRAGASPFELS